MSRYDAPATGRAVALRYDGGSSAPIVVASGMGYLAERIVEVANDNNVPVYEDNSLATMLSQLQLGQQIPDALYQAIVEIYVYFLNFDPTDPDKARRQRAEARQAAAEAAERARAEAEAEAARAAAEAAAAEAEAEDEDEYEDDEYE